MPTRRPRQLGCSVTFDEVMDGCGKASGTASKAVALGVRVPPPMLVIEWPDGSRLGHPLPLPGGATPCQYVSILGRLVTSQRRFATWWVQP